MRRKFAGCVLLCECLSSIGTLKGVSNRKLLRGHVPPTSPQNQSDMKIEDYRFKCSIKKARYLTSPPVCFLQKDIFMPFFSFL